MAGDLGSAMLQVQARAHELDATADLDAWIHGDTRGNQRQREIQSVDDLKKELEEEFLTPSPRFNTEWLNRLQQYVLPVS